MTEQINQDDTAAKEAEEKALLRDRAKIMGLQIPNNISLENLRQKIADAMVGEEAGESEEEGLRKEPTTHAEIREELLNTQLRLVRCRITNMDPKKKDLPGEIFTVANEYIGTVRKFIPYGEATDEGYHIPFCLYTELEAKRFQNIRTVRDRRTGQTQIKTSWDKEFAIEVLPQLTQKELDELAAAQLATGSVEAAGDTYMA